MFSAFSAKNYHTLYNRAWKMSVDYVAAFL